MAPEDRAEPEPVSLHMHPSDFPRAHELRRAFALPASVTTLLDPTATRGQAIIHNRDGSRRVITLPGQSQSLEL